MKTKPTDIEALAQLIGRRQAEKAARLASKIRISLPALVYAGMECCTRSATEDSTYAHDLAEYAQREYRRAA
jgi:hypothetical protein